MGLFLGQGFIEVEHRAGGDRPGGQFHRVQAGEGGVFAGADPLGRQFGLVRVSGSVAPFPAAPVRPAIVGLRFIATAAGRPT